MMPLRILLASLLIAFSTLTAVGQESEPDEPRPAPTTSATQEPSEDPLADSDEGDEDEEEDEPQATLRIICDAACRIDVDGEIVGEIEAGEILETSVDLEKGVATASSLEILKVRHRQRFKRQEEGAVFDIAFELAEKIIEAREIERQAKVYRDQRRGLMWARFDNGVSIDWRRAGVHCRADRLGGYDDWRLPTLDELKSIHWKWSPRSLKTVNELKLSSCCPWSTTTDGSNAAWHFDFRFHRPISSSRSYSAGLRALCVRELTQADDDEEEAWKLAAREAERQEKLDRKAAAKAAKAAQDAAADEEAAAEAGDETGDESTDAEPTSEDDEPPSAVASPRFQALSR